MADRIRVAVCGSTGYTGIELVRLLLGHPRAELVRATSEQHVGRTLCEIYPSLGRRGDLVLEPLSGSGLTDGIDLLFSALPHGAAATTVIAALEAGVRVVDLSADFRLRDASVFRRWYGEHPAPELLAEAVYGIPEFCREEIRGARLVANPGCYPTGALFGLQPLARAGRIGSGTVIVDSKSGVSGAGRKAETRLLFAEIEESVSAYGIGTHRHTPEIEQELAAAGGEAKVIFTPHLLPIRRGILSTIYVPWTGDDDPGGIFHAAYDPEPFVTLLGEGSYPSVRDVRGTNHVQLGWKRLEDSGMLVVVTAIDNLGRGASSQAIQSMNVMFGLAEDAGIDQIAAVP